MTQNNHNTLACLGGTTDEIVKWFFSHFPVFHINLPSTAFCFLFVGVAATNPNVSDKRNPRLHYLLLPLLHRHSSPSSSSGDDDGSSTDHAPFS